MRHNEIVCLRTNIGNGNEWGYDFSDILCDKRGMGVLVNRCAAVTRPAFFAPSGDVAFGERGPEVPDGHHRLQHS